MHRQALRISAFSIVFLLFWMVNCDARGTVVGGSKSVLTAHVGAGGIGGYVNAGAGLEYELFTRDGHLSLALPFDVYYGGTVTMGSEYFGDPTRTNLSGYYITPNVKYHPMGNEHRADLGIGLGIALGNEHRKDERQPTAFIRQNSTAQETLCMALLETSVNLQGHSHFLIGFFLNGGYMLSHTKSTIPASADDADWTIQIGFKMGGRF